MRPSVATAVFAIVIGIVCGDRAAAQVEEVILTIDGMT